MRRQNTATRTTRDRKMGLIPNIPGAYRIRAVNREQKEIPKLDTKDDVIKAYPKLFSGLGKLKGEYTIRLQDKVKPYCLYTPRRVPLPLMKKVEDEIKGLVKSAVIEPVEEPTDWCAPTVVVPKLNRKVRLCVDLTKLNKGVHRIALRDEKGRRDSQEYIKWNCVFQARCEFSLSPSGPNGREREAYNVYYTVWAVHVQEASVWYMLSS